MTLGFEIIQIGQFLTVLGLTQKFSNSQKFNFFQNNLISESQIF